eukprot:c2657_g1_i1.p1 GENE.c2657_g1_i1~~c2657_g1_i1.p1  ORF type:complete len:210 (-),score=64.85 c2657_g1_i1:55-684(-)
MQQQKNFDYTFRLVMVGDATTGKSSLILRFADNKFFTNTIATTGVDFRVQQIALGNKQIRLQIWDTAGQERYQSISKAYYRNADKIVLVYDTTNRKSFEQLDKWMRQLLLNANGIPVMLIGTKCDLIDQRKVLPSEGLMYAQKHGMDFLETSSKEGVSVTETFVKITQSLLDKRNFQEKSKVKQQINVNVRGFSMQQEKQEKRKNNCCH